MDSNQLFDLFRAYLEQLPTLLALLIGIVFAITQWKRHPKVAMVVVAGLGFLLLHLIIFTIVYNVVPRWFIRSSAGYENLRKVIDNVYLVLGLISNSVFAVGFGILLAGIFMRRSPVAPAATQTSETV